MNLTVNELYGIYEGLTKILDKELPVRVALIVQRNYKAIGDELKGCEEVRKRIVEKYKKEDNEDGTVNIDAEKIEDYRAEIRALMEQDIDVPIKKIKAEELGGSVSPRAIILLDPIIEL